jgi:hypothetical protein
MKLDSRKNVEETQTDAEETGSIFQHSTNWKDFLVGRQPNNLLLLHLMAFDELHR